MSCEAIRIFQMGDVIVTDNCDDVVVPFDSPIPGIRVRFEDVARRRGICAVDGYSLLLECQWEAVDRCGNSSIWKIFIKVSDNTPPVIAGCPANTTVNFGSTIPTAPTLTATDNCSDVVNVSLAETSAPTGNNCDYNLIRTWTATDECGNFSRCQQKITVAADTFIVKFVTTPPTACGGNDGTITMIPTQGIAYAWADGVTGPYRTALRAGTYTVTASRGFCQKVFTITVTDGCVCVPPVATVQKTDATCNAINGSALIVVDNTSNYTYTWSDGGSTTNVRKNLAIGNYSVTVSRIGFANCSTVVSFTIGNNLANCCTSFIAQTTIVKTIIDCNSTTDVCVEIPTSAIGNYVITDNGANYINGYASCTAGTVLRFGNGNHTVIFTSPLGCKDTLNVKVTCSPDIIINKTVTYPQTDSTCLTASQFGLTGTIVSVTNECAGSENNTQITINPITQCIRYKSLSVGTDTLCLRILTSTGGSATAKLIITVNLPLCGHVVSQDSVVISDACTANPKVCVNIPFDLIPNFDILLGGTSYTGTLDGCKTDTTFAYSYYTIEGRSASGPYRLDYWTVGGSTYVAPIINTIEELVVHMNIWDPTGHWLLNPSSKTIVGGDRNKIYGPIKMTRLSNGSYGIMDINTNIVPQATILDISRGHSVLVFVNQSTGCADTVIANVACVTPQYIENTMFIGDKDTVCIATNELLGTRYQVSKMQASTNTFARFSDIAGTTCIARTALTVGTEKAIYVIKDEYGVNDTTYITTHVYARTAKRPVAIDDKAATIKTKPVLIDVLVNDSLNAISGTLTIVTQPKHGEVIVTPDYRIIYTPNIDYCSAVPDTFTYQLCTIGGCSQAKVQVTISCDKVKIFNGFSPNGDGVNDFFVIQGIENYPNNKVSIYNRWGNEVMTTKGYKNDWSGKWNGIDLPDGTYFYILDDGEGTKYSGYIQITH